MTYQLQFDRDTPSGRERLTNPNVADFTTIENIMIWAGCQGWNGEGEVKITITESNQVKTDA